jgi:hypothetical protein
MFEFPARLGDQRSRERLRQLDLGAAIRADDLRFCHVMGFGEVGLDLMGFELGAP